ncbi:MAG: hypothetical protein ACI3VN_00950 [Candidatus Onthomonas sp.]
MKTRRSLLISAFSLALFFILSASLMSSLSSKSQKAAHTVSSVQTIQQSAVQPEDNSYLIRTVEDEVCIFQGDTLILRTGVTASLLPQQDREALVQGIRAESRAELTSLLEDLSS